MKFDQYPIADEVKKALQKLDFRRPTDIQFKAIPPVLKGEDVLAIAQTGTGKTAAFAIPVIHRLHGQKLRQRRPDGIKCVVMVPTRELALQIAEAFEQLAQYTRVKTYGVVGGVEQDPQIAQLEKGIDVLVATPGRLFDLASQGHIRLNRVDTLILDEADHMLDLGFIKDIRDLIARLPKPRQTLFFSATIDEKIKKLAYSLVTNPIRIQISPKNPVAKNVTHAVVRVAMDDKRFFLERLVRENPNSKLLVFVRTQVRAERVQRALERVDTASQTIHGGKAQDDRLRVLEAFKQGTVQILIATDVSARGIDIPNVDLVVNYDLPTPSENYVHRVGRTGRGRHRGRAVSFCSEEEQGTLTAIETYLGQPIEELTLDRVDYAETLDASLDADTDWKALMREAEQGGKKKRKK